MPSPYIKQISKETGKSVSELERYWKKAKEITKDEFGISENDFKDKHYAYATAIVKKMAGVKESIITVADFINSGKSAKDFIYETIASGDFPNLDKGTVNKKIKKDKEDSEVIEKSRRDGTGPDGTGPHGRGAGPGMGRADGTGLRNADIDDEDEDDKDELPDPSMLEVVNGYYTENGIMLEALDKEGKNYFMNFESLEEAKKNGFEVSDEMII